MSWLSKLLNCLLGRESKDSSQPPIVDKKYKQEVVSTSSTKLVDKSTPQIKKTTSIKEKEDQEDFYTLNRNNNGSNLQIFAAPEDLSLYLDQLHPASIKPKKNFIDVIYEIERGTKLQTIILSNRNLFNEDYSNYIHSIITDENSNASKKNSKKIHYNYEKLDPYEFESFIKVLFEHLGFLATKTGDCGDHGIDVIARHKFLNIKYVIQCKRWLNKNVGEPEVRDLCGVY